MLSKQLLYGVTCQSFAVTMRAAVVLLKACFLLMYTPGHMCIFKLQHEGIKWHSFNQQGSTRRTRISDCVADLIHGIKEPLGIRSKPLS